jgi:putative DNA primase/helicase
MPFSATAPKYWAVNLPVIPLLKGEKRPAISRWQEFCDRMPTEEERMDWLSRFPDGNIGLPLGPCSGLVAVDIDSDDPIVIAAIERCLPPTPWHRVGKKGKVLIYGYNGQSTGRVRDEDGKTIYEVLSRGTQIVLPPSIHPDTLKPYWSNCELTEAVAAWRQA